MMSVVGMTAAGREVQNKETVRYQYVSLFCTSRSAVVETVLKVLDLEKLSCKCASLVKIGANHVKLLLDAHTSFLPWRKWVASPVFLRVLDS